jgi:hypothetical protein
MHWYNINSKNKRLFVEGKYLQIFTHIFPHFVTSQWRHNNKFWIFKPAYTKLQSLIFRTMGRYFFYLIYLLRLRLWKNHEKASIPIYIYYIQNQWYWLSGHETVTVEPKLAHQNIIYMTRFTYGYTILQYTYSKPGPTSKPSSFEI